MNTVKSEVVDVVKPNASGAFARAVKKLMMFILILLIGSVLLWVWYVRERIADLQLEDTVKEEVSRVESKLDERGDAIEMKLDRIEGKLDRLLFLLEPRLPDGMSQAE